MEEDAFSNAATSMATTTGKKKKLTGFSAMGLRKEIMKGIYVAGFSAPTPIQKKAIPLLMQGRDLVAMARTGSGKTAAFLIPMLQRLASHSPSVGARALILSPTRELALQTLRFYKQLALKTDLRVCILAGGFSLDDQFADMSTNPDIIMATPGRLLHILDETKMKLKTIEYVVLDEADRLFEMGLADQISDILRGLPDQRQTALFSATMPQMLAEFGSAKLREPILIRLDTEVKLSENLKLIFFTCRHEQKVAVLLFLLRTLIDVQKCIKSNLTIIFVPTRHHCEFLLQLLRYCGFPCTMIHGNMDQDARQKAVNDFRRGKVPLMIVTDLAARGIDIPLLNNVINYGFPPTPKLFIHRVGRAARQGRSGTAYSLVSMDELPYMLDLHLYLGRHPMNTAEDAKGTALKGSEGEEGGENAEDAPRVDHDGAIEVGPTEAPQFDNGFYGSIPEPLMIAESETIDKFLSENCEAESLFTTSNNAQRKYLKTRPMCSTESVRRCKALLQKKIQPHPMIAIPEVEVKRTEMVEHLKTFRPVAPIFDCSEDGTVQTKVAKPLFKKRKTQPEVDRVSAMQPDLKRRKTLVETLMDPVDKSKARATIQTRFLNDLMAPTNTEDVDFFIPYQKSSHLVEQALAVNNVRAGTIQIHGDDAETERKLRQVIHWDKRKKNFVKAANDDMAKRGITKRRNEAGQFIDSKKDPHIYERWMKKTNLRIQDVGEEEDKNLAKAGTQATKRFARRQEAEERKANPEEAKRKKKDKKVVRYGRDGKILKPNQSTAGTGKKNKKGGGKRHQMFSSTGGQARKMSSNKYTTISSAATSSKRDSGGRGGGGRGGRDGARGGRGGGGGRGSNKPMYNAAAHFDSMHKKFSQGRMKLRRK